MTAAIVAASSSAETPHDSKPRRCELTWVSMVVSTLAMPPGEADASIAPTARASWARSLSARNTPLKSRVRS